MLKPAEPSEWGEILDLIGVEVEAEVGVIVHLFVSQHHKLTALRTWTGSMVLDIIWL